MTHRPIWILCTGLVLSTLSACGEGAGPGQASSVVVEPQQVEILFGHVQAFTATVRDDRGRLVEAGPVEWRTSDSTVVDVDLNGLATALRVGEAVVVATAAGVAGSTAVSVAPIGFTSVSAGDIHGCGITTRSEAYCWGDNLGGQLGDGTKVTRPNPRPVLGGIALRMITAGSSEFTCGISTTDEAYCWGWNPTGQLGDGSLLPRLTPVPVVGGYQFTSLDAGGLYVCALSLDRNAYCWGDAMFGQLGTGDTVTQLEPTLVVGGHRWVSLAVGSGHTCGINTAGETLCWGRNGGGIGDSTFTDRATPTLVVGNHSFQTISAGLAHTCAVTTDGFGYCWGWNTHGQLGDGSVTGRNAPVAVAGGLTFTVIEAGGLHTCGLTTDGAAYCWGWNFTGQLGQPWESLSQSEIPVPVSGGRTFVSVDAGGSHTCGMGTDGLAYCWGFNGYGRLGIGQLNSSPTPLLVLGQQ